MMTLEILNRQRTKKINKRLLKHIVLELLAELEIETAELGINLVAAREMTLLNESFLQHEGSTDVITFNHLDDSSRQAGERSLHGELFVCVDEAILQAKRFKTTWQSEIVRYLVHGVLHLLGHDDCRAAARRKMKREENRLLVGLSRKFNLAKVGAASKLGV